MRCIYLFFFIFLTGCIKQDRLSLGKGKESILLFEEFLCPACQVSINSDLDPFVKTYIKKGKVNLTIIPTAFFQSSRPSFTAFHQINQYHPSLLYSFFLFIYQIPQEELITLSTEKILSQFYETSPNFNLKNLIETINENSVNRSIKANCALLEKFYEGDMHLPTYIFKGKTIAGGNLLPILIESLP
jgi:protein-disulfide isomerase